jgi:hypothetical protein
VTLVVIFTISSCKKKHQADENRSATAANTQEIYDSSVKKIKENSIRKKGQYEVVLTKNWSTRIEIPEGPNTFRMDPLEEPVTLEVLVNSFKIVTLAPTNSNGWVSSQKFDGSHYQIRVATNEAVDTSKVQITLR